jgi:multiple inositol-polyphosphate phosphatase/2,3-bisphosphoglycerate 3-phosphatase
LGNPVCQLFSDSELQMMEYREDLEYYWQDGYGFDINYQQACVLMKDVIENFEKVIMVYRLIEN